MHNTRIIPLLHVKGPNLVKGVHLEGLRVLGKPEIFAKKYYEEGADEIIYIDTVASLYGRNNLFDVLSETVKNVFIPICAGGGIRSVEDARKLLNAGADKIAVNTAAVERPALIKELANVFGSQSIVSYIEVAKSGGYGVMVDNGRQYTGLQLANWIQQVQELGAGEILLTSVDKDGTRKGFDNDLLSIKTNIPIIMHGGAGILDDFKDCIHSGANAVCASSVFHYNYLSDVEENSNEGVTAFIKGERGERIEGVSFGEVKTYLEKAGIKCRMEW